MMQTVFQTALDVIAKWPDEKFDAALGYMRSNMDARDVRYIEAKRRIMREHGETFPRQSAFTLVKR
jgi:hypothetical protein